MFSSIRDFTRRNRRKMLITGGVVAAGWLLVDYMKKKLAEVQERIAEEKYAKEQIRRRFEQNQKDALYMILSLAPSIIQPLLDSLPVETITAELQTKIAERKTGSLTGTSDELSVNSDMPSSQLPSESGDSQNARMSSKTKSQLWTELKMQSITRMVSGIYTVALLMLFTRLQLNMLARRSFMNTTLQVTANKYGLDHLNTGEGSQSASEVEEAEQMFLCFSWWLINRGWVTLREHIREAVEKTFAGVSPRSEITLDEFAVLLSQVHVEIEGPDLEKLPALLEACLMPPVELERFVLSQTALVGSGDEAGIEISPQLRTLLDESREYIRAPTTAVVANKLVCAGIYRFLDITASIKPIVAGLQRGDPMPKVKLASLLASTTKQVHELARNSGNVYIADMDRVGELEEFSAVVYSNFDWK